MIRINTVLASIISFLFIVLAKVAKCDEMSKEEVIALTRDHLARGNPDELLHGFIPVWAIIIYVLSGTFFIMAVFSGICYLFGCRNTQKRTFKSAQH